MVCRWFKSIPDNQPHRRAGPMNWYRRRKGSEAKMGNDDLLERFLSKVQITEECWLWTGAANGNGYGHISINKKPVKAHRLSYELHKGSIPTGLVIDHLCRNRRCVRPDHLEAVTQKENLRRSPLNPAMAGGMALAAKKLKNECCIRGHVFSAENTVVYRGARKCRECHRTDERNRYRQKKRLNRA